MVRQNWIAASESNAGNNNAGRPALPSCGASQVMSLFNQISSDPRLRNDAE